MEKVVIDSSVVIKWFANEPDTEQALQLLDYFERLKTHVLVPDITLYEVANALRWNRNLPLKTTNEAVRDLLSLELEWITPETSLLLDSVALAYKHNLAVYDSVFISLADACDCFFITADVKQQKASRRGKTILEAIDLLKK